MSSDSDSDGKVIPLRIVADAEQAAREEVMDVLDRLLREIREGKMKAELIALIFTERHPNGDLTYHRRGNASSYTAVGLFDLAAFNTMRSIMK